MPYKDPEKRKAYCKEYGKKHYEANKQLYMQQKEKRRKALLEEVWEIKRRPCADCGVQYEPWIMQFDHIDPSTKEANVSRMIVVHNRAKLFAEIDKCEVVCANCHADRTYKRAGVAKR